MLWPLIVSFVILSLKNVIHIILLSQRFSQSSSRFSMCLVKIETIVTTQLFNVLSFKSRLTSCRLKIDLQDCSSLELKFYFYFSILNKFTIMFEHIYIYIYIYI